MDFCQTQVKADCVELLSRFQITDSVRFQTFSKIWREMQFSQIYYGSVNHRERRAFSRLILDTAYSFFLPPYSFQIRVGGLYLLYSLYQCQITSPPEQIRLALKDWEDVKKLEKDAVNAQHHDVVYILRKLMFDKAFSFTAMPTMLVFKKKRKVERPELCEEFMERPSRPQELINIELLEMELSNIDELYGKLKASVSSDSQQTDSSIDLVQKDLVPQLRSTVVDFFKWQHKKVRLVKRKLPVWRQQEIMWAFVIITLWSFFSTVDAMTCLVRMVLMKMKTAVRARHLSRSAPKEPSSSPPSNQRPTERQQRPPSHGVIVRWRWTSRATWLDRPTRQVTPEPTSHHSKPEPTRAFASQVTCGKKLRHRLGSGVSPNWALALKEKIKRTISSSGDDAIPEVILQS